jgi:hypothetical protein
MKGLSWVRIKTHAAFGVGIGAKYGLISSNKLQICDFLDKILSERFAGFSGEGKRVIGA